MPEEHAEQSIEEKNKIEGKEWKGERGEKEMREESKRATLVYENTRSNAIWG
jgi:hypothetical protein